MKSFINSNSFYPSGSAGIIELQNLKVFQIFEGYSVPLAKRMEKGYGYGFNGQERDDEMKGSGNSYDFGARMYDPRIARFFSIDPKASSFPYWSPYLFAANNPIRFIDVYGEGPGDRIKKALSFLGTSYKQQTESNLRTGTSAEALKYMDCSELVCRVLAADGFTSQIKNMNTTALISYMNKNSETFMKATAPKSGDVVLWKGHTGIVKDYDEESKRVTVVHATKYKKRDGSMVESVVEESYSMDYYNKKGAAFYRPKGENGEYVETEDGEEYFNGSNAISLIRKHIEYKKYLTERVNSKPMEYMPKKPISLGSGNDTEKEPVSSGS